MAQTKHEIQSLLSAAGTEPRHRFGQNFMIDQNLVRLVADAGEISCDDVVIEVGPGTGTLTEELLARAGRVIAVEIDRDLAAMLRERFAESPKFSLIEGDALAGKHQLNEELLAQIRGVGASPTHSSEATAGASARRPRHEYQIKLIANLPYNIASPLVIELLIAGVDLLAFTVQKEVADRLRAAHSTEAYGPLTVMAQMLSRLEVLRTLPPQAFWPAPKIDSALVRMRRDDRLCQREGEAPAEPGVQREGGSAEASRSQPGSAGIDASEFGRFVSKIFSARRKTLRKSLANANIDPRILEDASIDPQLRPENLTPQQFVQIFSHVKNSSPAR